MAATSAVSLTKQQQDLVDRLVETGRFDGANDVVAVGLHLVEERERQADVFIQGLEAEIERGLASGPSEPLEPMGDLLLRFRAGTI